MAGRKENLKALFTNTRTRVIIVFTVVLLFFAVVIGLFKFMKSTPEELAPTARLNSTPNVQSIPGVLEPTPQYAKLQEEQNQIQAKEAEKKGSSAIPTIIRTQSLGEGMEVVGGQGGESGVGFVSLSQGNERGEEQSLWVQQVKDAQCNKSSLEKATTKGITLAELKNACTCVQLKDFGYSLQDLATTCSCQGLKDAGYKAKDLKAVGYTAARLRACGFIACEMHTAGFSAQELMDGGFSAGELKGAGYGDTEIAQASGLPGTIKPEDVQKAGCNPESLAELRKSGVSAAAIKRISGCDIEVLKQSGFSATDLKNAGYSAAELKRAQFTPNELKQAGFSARDLLNAGYTSDDLLGSGFTEAQIQAAEAELPPGITPQDIKNSGCDVDVLTKERAAGVSAASIRKEAGCDVEALKAAGFSEGNLVRAGFSADVIKKVVPLSDAAIQNVGCDPVKLKQLLAKGVSVKRIKNLNNCDATVLKNAGYALDSLTDAGFTPDQLKAAGYTQNQIDKAASYAAAAIAKSKLTDCSPESLRKAKEAGISALTIKNTLGCPMKTLVSGGYNAAELKNAGFSPAELKNAAFSATDLKNAGFDAKALKEAGYTAQTLKNAGFTAAALKEAELDAKALKDAGFTQEQLTSAGFTNAQLEEAGFKIPGTALANAPPETKKIPEITTAPTSSIQRLSGPNARLANDIAASNERLDRVLAEQNKKLAEQRLEQNISQRATDMQSTASQYLQSWAQVDIQSYQAGTEASETGAAQQGTVVAPINNGGNPAQIGQPAGSARPPIVKAGDILYAVIDTSIDSDEPGPVLATIVSPKLKGTRLIGRFELPANADKMVINFNVMSVPGASSTIGINAYAIDADTARTALSSRTDHHYLMRYGSLFASSFIEGLGNAIQTANTTITIGGTGGLTDTTVQNNRSGNVTLENAVIALSTVGKNWGQQAQQLFSRPTTVQVFSGTPVGVLFMQDLAAI